MVSIWHPIQKFKSEVIEQTTIVVSSVELIQASVDKMQS